MIAIAEQTAELKPWAEVAGDIMWPTLLIGNGASINLWGDFNYGSLYERADLSSVAQAVFSDLGVTNFETVLEAIHHAHVVVDALGRPTDDVDAQYEHVKDALFSAVNNAHVVWSALGPGRFDAIAEVLQDHDAVYTTNYDLCLYWARLNAAHRVIRRQVIDFFWNDRTFDPDSVEIRGRTAMYHLHGAVHLWQDDQGNNGKWTNADGGSLLSMAANYSPTAARWPLFVSEGSYKAKLRTIGQSPYLSFCLASLREQHGNVVVFGHSLSEQDSHIVAALNAGEPREVAVSIHPGNDAQWIIQEKARITQLLGGNTARFFDSTTHPLGVTSLTVPKTP